MRPSQLDRLALMGLCVNITLFVVLLILTWDRLGDLLIDYPHELYSAWLMAHEGKVPWRDFEYIYGPLPLFANAWAMKLFGIHNHSVQALTAMLAFVATLAVWEIFRKAWGAAAATGATVCFQLLSVFSALPVCTTMNLLTPYSHAIPWGMTLGMVALVVWAKAFEVRRIATSLAAAGLAGALAVGVGLTKPELAIACWGALIVILGARMLIRHRERVPIVRLAGAFAAGALAAGALSTLLALRLYSFTQLPHVLGAAFVPISAQAVGGVRQLAQLGLDRPLENSLILVQRGGIALLLLVLIRLWSAAAGQLRLTVTQKRSLALLSFAPLCLLALAHADLAHQLFNKKLIRGLPLVSAVAYAWVVGKLIRNGRQQPSPSTSPSAESLTLALGWGTYSLLVLSRMPLNTRLYEYGFYQAVPAVLFCGVVMADALMPRPSQTGTMIFRWAYGGLVMAFVLPHALTSAQYIMQKSYLVNTSNIRLFTLAPPRHPHAEAILTAVRELRERIKAQETFVALPAGNIIHYLTEKPNPLRYHQLGPYEMQLFGEKRILQALDAARPTYIVVVHRPYGGFPPLLPGDFFGWLAAHYSPIALFGNDPFVREDSYGVEVWSRQSDVNTRP